MPLRTIVPGTIVRHDRPRLRLLALLEPVAGAVLRCDELFSACVDRVGELRAPFQREARQGVGESVRERRGDHVRVEVERAAEVLAGWTREDDRAVVQHATLAASLGRPDDLEAVHVDEVEPGWLREAPCGGFVRGARGRCEIPPVFACRAQDRAIDERVGLLDCARKNVRVTREREGQLVRVEDRAAARAASYDRQIELREVLEALEVAQRNRVRDPRVEAQPLGLARVERACVEQRLVDREVVGAVVRAVEDDGERSVRGSAQCCSSAANLS